MNIKNTIIFARAGIESITVDTSTFIPSTAFIDLKGLNILRVLIILKLMKLVGKKLKIL